MVKEILTQETQDKNIIRLLQAEPTKKDFKTTLVIGVMHGEEPEGEELIYNLIFELNENTDLATGNQILFIPCLNPDGRDRNTRGNANGVDLNRNFPTNNWELSSEKNEYYSGLQPASEIETRFLINVIETYKPNFILTIHTPYKIVNYDGPAQSIAEKISELNGYPVQDYIGYPTPGSFGTYTGIERNIPVITLELPDKTSINALWEENRKALLFSISDLPYQLK